MRPDEATASSRATRPDARREDGALSLLVELCTYLGSFCRGPGLEWTSTPKQFNTLVRGVGKS